MRKNIALAILLIAASCPAAGQAPDGSHAQAGGDEQELMRIEQEWAQAEVQSKIGVLDRILADNFIDSSPTEGRKKAQLMAEIASGTLKFESNVREGQYKLDVYGNTATITYQAAVKGQDKGLDISGRYAITHVYLETQGRWRAVASYRRLISRPPTSPPPDGRPARPMSPAVSPARLPQNINPYILLGREVKARRTFSLRFRPVQLETKVSARAEVAVRERSLLVRVRAKNLPPPSRFGEKRYTLFFLMHD